MTRRVDIDIDRATGEVVVQTGMSDQARLTPAETRRTAIALLQAAEVAETRVQAIPPMVLIKGDRVRVTENDLEAEGTVTKVDGGMARVEFSNGLIGIYDQVNDDRIVRL